MSPTLRVALVAMPWPLYNRPSIQLGALKAALAQRAPEVEVTLFHPYLAVARALGPERYSAIGRHLWLAESLYARLAHDFPAETAAAVDRFLQRQGRQAGLDRGALQACQETLSHQLTQWLDTVDWHRFHLVGFTVCFNQLNSSLAAARAIRLRNPRAAILFGGTSITPALGQTLKERGCLDHWISGEGEAQLLALCAGLAGNEPPATGPAPALDQLPEPDYRPYFAEYRRLFGTGRPVLPVEFSRGCWWNKCTFCNLNRQWQGYRAKSAQRMVTEIRTLANRHQCLDFAFTDNNLPVKAGREFFRRLAGGPYRFFAEVRAQQADDFAVMARGGLRRIQVGIEALADPLLRRLGKGTSVAANIYAMKRAAEANVVLEGNLITEFPGSTDEDVTTTLANLEYVRWYPPLAPAAFFLGLDAPVARQPHKYGIRQVVRHPFCRFLAPFPLPFDILGYRGDRTVQRRRWRPVRQRLHRWQEEYRRARGVGAVSLLTMRDGGDFLMITGRLADGRQVHHRLAGASAAIYRAMDRPISPADLRQRFASHGAESLDRFLAGLAEKRLIYRDEQHYLALATVTDS